MPIDVERSNEIMGYSLKVLNTQMCVRLLCTHFSLYFSLSHIICQIVIQNNLLYCKMMPSLVQNNTSIIILLHKRAHLLSIQSFCLTMHTINITNEIKCANTVSKTSKIYS